LARRRSRTPPASGSSELCVASSDSRSLGKSGQVVEIAELDRVLKENFYNRTRTAKQLGISCNALYKRIKKLGLSLGGS
ncbi:MAG: helix-turn-helix domain-containing protein, partial [Pseudomonadales bacterium]